MYYTCRYSCGHIVHPLIRIGHFGGKDVFKMGEKTTVTNVTIVHDIDHGVEARYCCRDGGIYKEEDLHLTWLDAKMELNKRNVKEVVRHANTGNG